MENYEDLLVKIEKWKAHSYLQGVPSLDGETEKWTITFQDDRGCWECVGVTKEMLLIYTGQEEWGVEAENWIKTLRRCLF